MRHRPTLLALALFATSPLPPLRAEVTRTLKLAYAETSRPFAVDNLAGTMRVLAGSGPAVEVVVTVHAESSELADKVRFEKVSDRDGTPTLRVLYPLDETTHFRYPGLRGGGSSCKYEGRSVRISDHAGVLLYADVEVRLPPAELSARFRNAVGALLGQEVRGALRFDTDSGDISLGRIQGDIVADAGSGDVKAEDLGGSFRCDTGSGDCEVTGFAGDKLSLDTGSGDVRVHGLKARRLEADTGSGSIQVSEAELEELKADSGSGAVELDDRGSKLTAVKVDTGSGDVRLRLAPDASFDIGSGDIVNRFQDAEPIVHRREIVGYRRGDGKIRIDVDSGSGDLVLEPRP